KHHEINHENYNKVKATDLAVLTRQLATMVQSGMTILRALYVLEAQTENKMLTEAVVSVRKDVEAGLPLSDALERHPKIFSPLFVSMTRPGETGGTVGAVWVFRKWKSSERGRPQWDRFRLRVPMKIGDIVQKVALARWSRTLSALVSAGVPLLQALDITGQTAGNHVIEQAMAGVIDSVKSGGT